MRYLAAACQDKCWYLTLVDSIKILRFGPEASLSTTFVENRLPL